MITCTDRYVQAYLERSVGKESKIEAAYCSHEPVCRKNPPVNYPHDGETKGTQQLFPLCFVVPENPELGVMMIAYLGLVTPFIMSL